MIKIPSIFLPRIALVPDCQGNKKCMLLNEGDIGDMSNYI